MTCGVIRTSGFTMQQRLRTLSVGSVSSLLSRRTLGVGHSSSLLLRPPKINRILITLAALNTIADFSNTSLSAAHQYVWWCGVYTEVWQLFQVLIILLLLASTSSSAARQDDRSCVVIRFVFTMQQWLRTINVGSVSSRPLASRPFLLPRKTIQNFGNISQFLIIL